MRIEIKAARSAEKQGRHRMGKDSKILLEEYDDLNPTLTWEQSNQIDL